MPKLNLGKITDTVAPIVEQTVVPIVNEQEHSTFVEDSSILEPQISVRETAKEHFEESLLGEVSIAEVVSAGEVVEACEAV